MLKDRFCPNCSMKQPACSDLRMLPDKNLFGEIPVCPFELLWKLNVWPSPTGKKTTALFEFIEKLLPERNRRGLKAGANYRNHRKQKHGEFLVDFLWFAVRSRGGTSFAMESELSDNGLEHDFEKLLWLKSPLKLMVCRDIDLKGRDPGARLAEYAEQNQLYLKGEFYMLFVFGTEKKNNRAYYYVSPQDHAGKFKFSPLPLTTQA